ncbi:hypothetical protein LX36DRAFT_329218 [Colletotrichum falcatum]|nr:hypothetical protein LX36DRAFT_329218 [Colletotrichum falcatum]
MALLTSFLGETQTPPQARHTHPRPRPHRQVSSLPLKLGTRVSFSKWQLVNRSLVLNSDIGSSASITRRKPPSCPLISLGPPRSRTREAEHSFVRQPRSFEDSNSVLSQPTPLGSQSDETPAWAPSARLSLCAVVSSSKQQTARTPPFPGPALRAGWQCARDRPCPGICIHNHHSHPQKVAAVFLMFHPSRPPVFFPTAPRSHREHVWHTRHQPSGRSRLACQRKLTSHIRAKPWRALILL